MKIINLLGLFVLFLLESCTTSQITTSWKSNNAEVKLYKKVMVLGLIREADRTIQENMENHFVNDLKVLGYDAVSSLKEYGPKAFDKMAEDEAIAKLKNSGIDAVITIVLLDKEHERNYRPNNIYYSPFGYYNNWFWGYHNTLNRRIYEPGYFLENTKYFWESNLFDMTNQKLVYSVQTQSFDALNSESMGHHYGKMIVKNLLSQKILVDNTLAKLIK